MKKLLVVLAIIASVQVANAQSPKAKAVEAAKEAAANPKKADKPATWIKLGQTYLDAYNAPAGEVWIGATKADLQYVMKEKPLATEEVTLGGQPFTKEVYAEKNLYFNANGQLALIEVTKPVVDNALEGALDAYKHAAEVDPKGSKTKDINTALTTIAQKYTDEAYNAYQFGDYSKASVKFEASANAKETAPLSQIDTTSIYNAAFTAWAAGELPRAKSLFEKCASYGYYYNDGEVYAKLADIADKEGNKEAQQKYLEEGFRAYPSSQSILIGLINYYVTSGQNSDRLFVLLDAAKANEPTNASLYYVEGNIRVQFNQIPEAVAAYNKCAEINPDYEYGYIGLGQYYYNHAVELQEQAQNEMDDAKYMALNQEFENSLKSCVEPFEKAYEITKDANVKRGIAEYLKNACFRFRTEPGFQEKYEKYAAVVDAAQ